MKAKYNLIDGGTQPKPILALEDLGSLIEHHWKYSRVVYPTERERVQLSAFLLLLAYTGSRPGAIIESGSRPGNIALRWRDVEIWLWRQDDRPHVPFVIVLKITFAFRKGDEWSNKPYDRPLRRPSFQSTPLTYPETQPETHAIRE